MVDQTHHDLDPRHQRRIKLMQTLFAHTFDDQIPQHDDDPQVTQQISQILAELEEIDQQIHQFAPERPLTEVNKIDLAILRLIVFESKHKKTPKKVLIDEAVELAKEFGSESSPRFVNGVLGKLLMEEHD
ncbi:MAG: transcription antitermination factor NusB [Candidatus Pacebacteria bacterium]|nr:transcription antitermination factor NusB [Candidatus Paceibacterota bacterium]